MLYRPAPTGATAPEFSITGRNLAHARSSVSERAFVAAEIHLNRITVCSPTVKQAAELAHVSVPYVAAAITIVDDQDARNAVIHDGVCILDAAKHWRSRESLTEHLARSSPAELAQAAAEFGPDTVWELMLLPNL